MKNRIMLMLMASIAITISTSALAWEFSSVRDPIRDSTLRAANLISKRHFGAPAPGLASPQLRLSIREIENGDISVAFEGRGDTGLLIWESCGVWVTHDPCVNKSLTVRFDSEPAVEWPIRRAADRHISLGNPSDFLRRLRKTRTLLIEAYTYSLRKHGAEIDAELTFPGARYQALNLSQRNQFEFQIDHFSWPSETKKQSTTPDRPGAILVREAMMFSSFMEISNIGSNDPRCRNTNFEKFNIANEVDEVVSPVLIALAKKEGKPASDKVARETISAVKKAPTIQEGGIGMAQRHYRNLKRLAEADYPGHECAVVSAVLRELVNQKRLTIEAVSEAMGVAAPK